MAAIEAAFSIFRSYPSTNPKYPLCPKPPPSAKLQNSIHTPLLSLKFPPCPLPLQSIKIIRKLNFQLLSAIQEVEVEVKVEEKFEETQQPNQRRKLFVLNLPWSLSVADIKNLFGECGTVIDVEIIKQKTGKSRGFAFVTMSSGQEAQAVLDKFDSSELSGRIIRVEFAKRLKKPSPPRPPSAPPAVETRHKLYVSNLAWKVRSSQLREFFAANFNPVSARVVFDSPTGRSAGYGFVSFATKEEAEAAISELDGKELLGRPLRLVFSQKNSDESTNEKDEDGLSEKSSDESTDKKIEEDTTMEQPEQS